jgi:hypothetical protein
MGETIHRILSRESQSRDADHPVTIELYLFISEVITNGLKAWTSTTSAARTARRQRGRYVLTSKRIDSKGCSDNVYLKLLVKLYRFLARRMFVFSL